MYLLDQHGWAHRAAPRDDRRCWPGVRAEIRDVADGIEDAHAVMATCWESVYPVLASPAAGARMYFVQDYEPLFYPAGSHYLLAEATYRLRLPRHHGRPLAGAEGWRASTAWRPTTSTSAATLTTYRLEPRPSADQRRTGVCYYCRPSTPRRAHELAMAALELFAEQHPDVEIHLYGERLPPCRFAATQHGLLTPAELDALYNRLHRRADAVGDQRLPGAARDAGRRLHPCRQRRRAQPPRPRQRPRPLRPRDPFDLAAALGELCQAAEQDRAARARPRRRAWPARRGWRRPPGRAGRLGGAQPAGVVRGHR